MRSPSVSKPFFPQRSDRIVPWLRRGGFAVLDQALYSGANFLINILLARWLSAEDYGAFTVAFSFVFLATALHSAILTEPMLVFGAGKYEKRFPTYLALLLYGHCIVTLGFSAITGVAALIVWLAGSLPIAKMLWGLALSTPFILLASLARRAFYAVLKPAWAAAGSALYLVAVLAGIFIYNRIGSLAGGSSLVVIGIAGALTSLVLLLVLKPRRQSTSRSGLAREILADHWRYGRWAMGSSLLSSSYGTFYYLAVTVFLALQSVAVLRAVQNLFAPLSQIMLALTWLLVPWSAKRAQESGSGLLTRDAIRISAGLTAAATVYLVFMATAGPFLSDLLYAGRYAGQLRLICLIGVVQLFAAAGSGVHVVLRASGRSDLLLIVYLAGACISALGTLSLAALWGFAGAAAGIGLFPLTTSVAAWWMWLVKGRGSADGSAAGAAPQESGALL